MIDDLDQAVQLRKDRVIGVQNGFAESFNAVLEVLRNLVVVGDGELRRDGLNWTLTVSGGGSGKSSAGSELEVVTGVEWDEASGEIRVHHRKILAVLAESSEERVTAIGTEPMTAELTNVNNDLVGG